MTRIYQPLILQEGATLQLDTKASHHLAHVLRARIGESLTIFNGQGGEYEAEITGINKKGVDVLLKQFIDRDIESPLDICLAQGIARGEKMDWIMQKAVELGVRQIVPLTTERCNVRLDRQREEKRYQHWQSVIISACEQSGRNRLPLLTQPQSYEAWLPQAKADACFVLTPHQAGRLPDPNKTAIKSIILLVGPEGGLSDSEVEKARLHGFQAIKLGSRILRTETAPLAAISILQYCFGDMS